MHVQNCCFVLSSYCFFFLLSRRRCILNFLLFKMHWDPSETEFSYCKLNCSCWWHPKRFSTHRYFFRFWLGKLGERTGQLWRENSRRVRTHEKISGVTVRRLGTIMQSIFCAQLGTSIRLTVWKWSGESRYPGVFPPLLENFRRAFSSHPTDRPWVSEVDFRWNWKKNVVWYLLRKTAPIYPQTDELWRAENWRKLVLSLVSLLDVSRCYWSAVITFSGFPEH